MMEEQMIKLGILDFDSSHCVEFAKRLNHKLVAEEQWVSGAQVVVACPGESKLSPERIPGFTATMKKLEIPLVEKPEDMIGKVDGLLIEAVDGSVHLQRARPFLEAGIPCFIDKPFTCSVADARKLITMAEKHKCPIFSSSSLRYAPDLVSFLKASDHGAILGAVVYGPASLHERNPGLFHYGIHAVEVLYTLMGPGCERLTCTHERDADVVSGRWKDGRIATVRGTRTGAGSYGALIFCEKKTVSLTIGTSLIYRELLKKIVAFFTMGVAPVPIATTFEIVGFIEAALKSGNNHGTGEIVAFS